MGVIFFIIFMVMIFGKNNRDSRGSDIFKAIILLNIFGALLSMVFSPIGIIGAAAIIIFLVKRYKKKKEKDSRSEQYGWDPQRWDAERGNQDRTYQDYREQKRNGVKSKTLPAAVNKRRKIVEAFNEKYQLYLTPEQIKGIVDSSYMSEIWKKEVEAMSKKYETVYQWYPGYTKWLRVYLRAFHVQEVTSDIRQQENICMYAFEEVFQYVEQFPDYPLSEKIKAVNDKFFTAFDDVSFMVAYRFLESKGKNHDLGSGKIIREDQEIDDLLHKYENLNENQRAAQ